MADVYKFNVKLCHLENIIWRDIEITSVSSVAKLGYTVLAAFDSMAGHWFYLRFKGNHYEIALEEDDIYDMPVIDPIETKLSDLKLNVGDKISMVYDYGAGWEFYIELLSIVELKKGTGRLYPRVTDGHGKGIIDDTSPYELIEMIEMTNKENILPKVTNLYTGQESIWDYREFDLFYCDGLLKDTILRIQAGYEEDEWDIFEL